MVNQLAGAASAYLRQHAEQPVAWQPWGEAALTRARTEGKPIFLSIGYATCHWCHVMARESFCDPEVAARLNRDFIPVKVDREERPDLDLLYQLVCQLFTGGGGWPLSLFLAADGTPFFAGTYFPKNAGAELNRPGFIELLDFLARRWAGEREALLENGRRVVALLDTLATAPEAEYPLSLEPLAAAAAGLDENFVPETGGFGPAPRFPAPHQLLFLLAWQRRSGSVRALEMVATTLENIVRGGIFDQLDGGLHRYAVDARWRIPHFEKMLYDQAMLLLALAELEKTAPHSFCRSAAGRIVAWLEREMLTEAGLFAAAVDADSEGEEGAFYLWSRDEITACLGDESGLFFRFFGLEKLPAGEDAAATGRGVLWRREGPATPDEEARLAGLCRQLREKRSFRPRPFVDNKLICGWNGLVIAALARAGAVFDRPEWQQLSATTARALLSCLGRSEDRLWRCCDLGGDGGRAPEIPGFLEDYAFVIAGLLELAESSPQLADFREQALRLAATARHLFWDDAAGAFFSTPVGGETLIARPLELHDSALPAANSLLLAGFLKLYRLTGEAEYRLLVEKGLARLIGPATETPLLYLSALQVLGDYLE